MERRNLGVEASRPMILPPLCLVVDAIMVYSDGCTRLQRTHRGARSWIARDVMNARRDRAARFGRAGNIPQMLGNYMLAPTRAPPAVLQMLGGEPGEVTSLLSGNT